MSWRYCSAQPDHDREVAVAAVLVEVAGRLAADRGLDGGVDVARRQAVARGRARGRCRCGWSAGRASGSTARSVMPGTFSSTRRMSVAALLEGAQVGAAELDGVLALHAGGRLLDVVLDVLREVEVDAGELPRSARRQLVGQLRLVEARAARCRTASAARRIRRWRSRSRSVPSSGRPCWDTTVSTSGKPLISAAHAVDVAVALLERDRLAAGWRGSRSCLPRAWAGTRARGRAARRWRPADEHAAAGQRQPPRWASATSSTRL